jgi:hypothetical protein
MEGGFTTPELFDLAVAYVRCAVRALTARPVAAESGGQSAQAPVRFWPRDGGAKEQLVGKNPFSTDELLQFYGCVGACLRGRGRCGALRGGARLMFPRCGPGGASRWYKQATQGDCNTPQPGVWSIEARAKWNGWNKMRGLSADECRSRYLKQLTAKVPRDWTQWPNLDRLKSELVPLAAPCCSSCRLSHPHAGILGLLPCQRRVTNRPSSTPIAEGTTRHGIRESAGQFASLQ